MEGKTAARSKILLGAVPRLHPGPCPLDLVIKGPEIRAGESDASLSSPSGTGAMAFHVIRVHRTRQASRPGGREEGIEPTCPGDKAARQASVVHTQGGTHSAGGPSAPVAHEQHGAHLTHRGCHR